MDLQGKPRDRPAPHFAHWPPGLPRHLTLPQTHLFHNAEVSAARYPDKPFIVFYDSALSFAAVPRRGRAHRRLSCSTTAA